MLIKNRLKIRIFSSCIVLVVFYSSFIGEVIAESCCTPLTSAIWGDCLTGATSQQWWTLSDNRIIVLDAPACSEGCYSTVPVTEQYFEEQVCCGSPYESTCWKRCVHRVPCSQNCGTKYCECYSFQLGSCPGSPGGCSSCSVVNLQCPQYALVGSPFNISVEFQRGDSDYEGRSVWGPVYYPEQCFWFLWWYICEPAHTDYEELWCNQGDPTSECSWYSETPSVNCPTQPGAYTYDIGCAGYTGGTGGYYCGQDQQQGKEASCGVQCVTTLPTYLLTVSKAGTGAGIVTSNPAGVNCGTDCQETYSYGTQVTLTASPSAGSVFAGWSGACSGTGTTCIVSIDSAKNVTATFTLSSIGHIRVWNGSKIIKLNVIPVAGALAAIKGVIKVALPSGTIGAADLVETSDTTASPVRVRTPQGTKAWRKIE